MDKSVKPSPFNGVTRAGDCTEFPTSATIISGECLGEEWRSREWAASDASAKADRTTSKSGESKAQAETAVELMMKHTKKKQ